MGVTTIERSLSNPGSHGNLMHTDGINAPLGEEAPGNLQDTSTMLRCVAPFGSLSRYERLWQA